jgi:serine/threonine-protein kinase
VFLSCERCGGRVSEFDVSCHLCGERLPDRLEGDGPAPLPDRVAGYRVHDRLGAGGMGVVYRAAHSETGRVVALKVIAAMLADDPIARTRLVREAEVAGRVNHPAVAEVYEIGEADGLLYIAMELCEGETLKARLRRGPLAVAEAARVLGVLAGALAAAHAASVVHRDLKPANVILSPHGTIKLLDFGLAKLLASDHVLTHGRALVGTPAYMAPEQILGEPVDHRADLWALGVVAYEMIAGRSPFAGPGGRKRVLLEDPPLLASQREGVPAALDDLVLSLLAKRREDRRASAAEVVRALAEIAPA